MEKSVVMMVGLNWQWVEEGAAILETQGLGAERNLWIVADYQMSNVSEKVVRIIVNLWIM